LQILADTTPDAFGGRVHNQVLEIDRIPAALAQHFTTARKIVLRLSDRPSYADTVF
jgi:hypothetical protein